MSRRAAGRARRAGWPFCLRAAVPAHRLAEGADLGGQRAAPRAGSRILRYDGCRTLRRPACAVVYSPLLASLMPLLPPPPADLIYFLAAADRMGPPMRAWPPAAARQAGRRRTAAFPQGVASGRMQGSRAAGRFPSGNGTYGRLPNIFALPYRHCMLSTSSRRTGRLCPDGATRCGCRTQPSPGSSRTGSLCGAPTVTPAPPSYIAREGRAYKWAELYRCRKSVYYE